MSVNRFIRGTRTNLDSMSARDRRNVYDLMGYLGPVCPFRESFIAAYLALGSKRDHRRNAPTPYRLNLQRGA